MPLPIVYPKRRNWYEKEAGGARWNLDTEKLEKNLDDFLQIKRWKFYREFQFVEDFINNYKKQLGYIQRTLSLECTQKLQELVEERAYVQYIEGKGEEWYDRSYMFPTSFQVGIFIKNSRLMYTIKYFYNDLEPELGEQLYGSHDRTLPRYLSLYGVDVRDDLPDILNTPVTMYESDYDARFKKKVRRVLRKTGRREGRYFQVFDNWFRTELYDEFLRLCKEQGLII